MCSFVQAVELAGEKAGFLYSALAKPIANYYNISRTAILMNDFNLNNMWNINNLTKHRRHTFFAMQKELTRLKQFKGPYYTAFFNFNLRGLMCHLSVVMLLSCSRDYHQNLSVYRMVDASLNGSRSALTSMNNEIINAVPLNYPDSVTRSNMVYWLPKMKVINQRSMAVISYVDSLKLLLKLEAGLKLVSGKEVYGEEDYKAVSTLFGKDGKGKELRERILNFKNELLAIDPRINDLVNNLFITTARIKDPLENPSKTFEATFFQHLPAVGAMAILGKFQNDVSLIEYQLLLFCRDKLPS